MALVWVAGGGWRQEIDEEGSARKRCEEGVKVMSKRHVLAEKIKNSDRSSE